MFMIKKKVFWLQIPVYNVQLMDVFNSGDNLLIKLARLSFLELLFLDNVVKKLSATCILHYKIEQLRSLNYFVKLNNVWVTNQLKNVNLSCNALDIRGIGNSILLQNLNCHFLACQSMRP